MVIIYFDWTVRILNHRSFCARLVRLNDVPDTMVKLKKNPENDLCFIKIVAPIINNNYRDVFVINGLS